MAGEGQVGVSVLSTGFSKQGANRGVRVNMVEAQLRGGFRRKGPTGEPLVDITYTAAFTSDTDAHSTLVGSKTVPGRFLLQIPLHPARDLSQKPTTEAGRHGRRANRYSGQGHIVVRAVSISHERQRQHVQMGSPYRLDWRRSEMLPYGTTFGRGACFTVRTVSLGPNVRVFQLALTLNKSHWVFSQAQDLEKGKPDACGESAGIWTGSTHQIGCVSRRRMGGYQKSTWPARLRQVGCQNNNGDRQ